jgi:peptidyl-prolyl cis-trans isomerase C
MVGAIFVMLIGGSVQAEILANVNGIGISSDRLEQRIQTLSTQEQQRAKTPQGMRIVLQQIIAEEVLYQEAQRNHIGRLTPVLDRIEQARREAMVGEMASRMLQAQGDIEAVRAHYNAHKQDYKRVRASHIVTNSIDGIKEARSMLGEGMDFAAVAKKFSTDPSAASNGGDLGFFTHQMMVPAFADVAFSMKVNELRGPVKTQFGYHLIKLVDIQSPGDFDALGENEQRLIRRELFQRHLDTLHTKAKIEMFDAAVSKYMDGPKPSGVSQTNVEDAGHDE